MAIKSFIKLAVVSKNSENFVVPSNYLIQHSNLAPKSSGMAESLKDSLAQGPKATTDQVQML
jgi:hypothetical protein